MRGSRPWRLASGSYHATVKRALAWLPGRGAVILRYHSVNDDATWARESVQWSLVVPPEVFDAQVAFLKTRHVIVSIDRIVDFLRAGKDPNTRWLAITFDDGYEDNHRHAFRILKKHGVTGAFYVTTGSVGDAKPLWTVELRRAVMRTKAPRLVLPFMEQGPLDISTPEARDAAIRLLTKRVKRCGACDALALLEEVRKAADEPGGGSRVMMNWDEIRELHEGGMTIGAHTVRHFNLPSLSDDDLAREVRQSREDLERELGGRVRHFAYPNGRTDCHCDARVAHAVAAAGFESAVTSVAGAAMPSLSAFAIPRVGVYRRHDDLVRLESDIQRARFSCPRDQHIRAIARAMRGGATSRGRKREAGA